MQEIEPAETELVKKLVTKDMVCLDIGANVGYYSVLMAKQCKLVYAFEPEPNNYRLLKKNCSGLDVITFDCAVVDFTDCFEQPVILYLCTENYNGRNGMHRIYPSKWCSDKTVNVDAITIDDMHFEVMKIGFIKMDIEGSEYGALKGMEQLLKRDKPIMLIEFHPPSIEEYGAKPEDEYNFLVDLGYKITLIPGITINSYQQLDKLTRDDSGGKNILCQ